MGMYTQVRGWLNVDSISYGTANYDIICRRLREAQDTFMESQVTRAWVCQHTWAHQGGNGSVFLFIGTELKNYESEAEQWIEYLLQYFPNAEGRIDFQYEEEYPTDPDARSRYWLIAEGKVMKNDVTPTWCYGYGNSWERDE